MRQLFIDLDGVLGDFDRHYIETIGPLPARWGTGQSVEDRDIDWKTIDTISFFATMPPLKDARDLWDHVKRYSPIVLTGCPKIGHEKAAVNKRNWVARHLGPDIEVRTCLSRNKCLSCHPGDILVDDWTKYRDLWLAKGGIWITHTSVQTTIEQLIRLGIT